MGTKQTGTATSSQQTQYPDWYQAAATAMTAPFMTPNKHMVAGMTEDQLMAGNLMRRNAQNAGGVDYAGKIMEAGGPVTGEQALELANPFYGSVGRDTIDTMRRERDNTSAMMGAQRASSVAFGGTGLDLARARLNRDFIDSSGKQINSIMASGYDRGMNQANSNADRLLAASTAASGAQSQQFADQRAATQDLMGYGTFTQAQAQQALDAPYLAATRYQGLVPGATVDSQPITVNPLETLLGLVGAGTSLYRGFNPAQVKK